MRPESATSTRRCGVCLSVVVAAAVLLPPAFGGRPPEARASLDSLDLSLHVDPRPVPSIAGRAIGTFAQAARFLGRPARIAPHGERPPTCEAKWPTLALRIDFTSAQPGSCAPRALGTWVDVEARDARWHTLAGLHVGATERRLLTLYPHTRRLDFLAKGRLWELETGGPLCDGGPTLALAGQVRSARVSALEVVRVPACG
jgi:hypothetical protein